MKQTVHILHFWIDSRCHRVLKCDWAFTAWIRRVLLPVRLPGAALPEVEDLQEVKSMLAERVIEWTQEWKQQDLQTSDLAEFERVLASYCGS